MGAALQSQIGLLKASFQSQKKGNKLNSGAHTTYITRQGPWMQLENHHYQVKELFQNLHMWMKSWGAVNKTAPQVEAEILWMEWQTEQRQSKVITDKRRANNLLCCRERLTCFPAWEQAIGSGPKGRENEAVVTTLTDFTWRWLPSLFFLFLFHDLPHDSRC